MHEYIFRYIWGVSFYFNFPLYLFFSALTLSISCTYALQNEKPAVSTGKEKWSNEIGYNL